MTRALYLDDADAKLLADATAYLGLLQAAEVAHVSDDDEMVTSLFTGVDPEDLRGIIDDMRVLHTSYQRAPIAIGRARTVPPPTPIRG